MRKERENDRFAFDFFSRFAKLTDNALVTRVYAVEGTGCDNCDFVRDVLINMMIYFQGGKDSRLVGK
jgi:hypothetical protein